MENLSDGVYEDVKFEKSYCAFLDVLGFKEYVLRNAGDHAAFQHVVRALRAGREQFKDPEERKFFKVKNFSDNVMVSVKHRGDGLFLPTLFEFICRYQKELVWHGMFVRGGVALGELYVGSDTIYGDALIEAYEIESQSAVYPVVMLSDKVIEFAKNSSYFHAATGVWRYGDFHDIFVCFEGRYYINYLKSAVVFFTDKEGGYSSYLDVHFLRQHQRLLQERLLEFLNSQKIYRKYCFLAKYHNAFCAACVRFDEYKDDLMVNIPETEVSFSSRAEFFGI
ncbi:hypothetical protein QMK47_05840 [Pseudomonas sp. P9_35]|uniref:hypothetical protein n=1 Tax=unclassified Pseudomonas TaxID=196821 RepID=UPI002A35D7CA|nr:MULTISPECIES: hypothetical protein [unclassified Pseudomonas]WPN64511.1 hypothetical protein QMK48_04935 [Pseudomonas sp. P9_32]WPN70263.1 hypothetical protein QMK47_05840 [Pseudomonas sp. P9_35]